MSKTIIYLRTSTQEQNPKNQLRACEDLADKLNIKNYEVFEEKLSGWKDIDREKFNQIKKAVEKSQLNNLIVWDLDRLYRNRKKLISFFEFCKMYHCKIYSVRQDWLESLNKIQEPFNEIMFNLMLQIMGWLAEEESNKKSERVKIAYKNHKGKKWGRKSLSQNVIDEVLELHHRGLSIRDISQSVFVWDKNRNKKNISVGSVHKIIKKVDT